MRKQIGAIGFWSGLAAAAATLTYDIVQILQIAGTLRFPLDEIHFALLANALVTPMIAIVYFYPVYSSRLLFLGFPWGLTAPLAMLLLAFAVRMRQGPQAASRATHLQC